jgi:Xaa-Pro dipeptidase
MSASLSGGFLARARQAMEEEGIDGWLLFDLEGRNRVASEILGLPEGTSRRHFVLLPREGEPVALTHPVERQKWETWPHEQREYVGWEEMEERLAELLDHCDWVAMEISERDAVPFVDYVAAGVVGLVESFDVRVVSSAALISRAYACWGEAGLRLHRRAASELARIAREAFDRAADGVRAGSPLSEYEVTQGVLEAQAAAGLTGGAAIVAGGPNSALPHYHPAETGSRSLTRGEVFLIDLWGRVAGEPEAAFADQTWMGILDDSVPADFQAAWDAVAAARDAAIELLARRMGQEPPPTGAEVDRHARQILIDRGFGGAILHRTGHAMDRVNHGFGPNLDSIETRDDRPLVPDIGFSVEPGLYFPGRWGIRSEVNVHLDEEGPEVSPPERQQRPWTLND